MRDVSFLFLALGLVLLNGFFVAAEFAIVKLRKTRVEAIQAVHGWRGRILATVHTHMDAYLSACQLGITLASLGLGWIGEPAFARLLHPFLTALGITSPQAIQGFAFAIAFFLISYLHIVVGELAPKSLAIRRPEQMALWTTPPLYAFYWVMYPLIWLLNHSALFLLKGLNLGAADDRENIYSTQELKLILSATQTQGELPQQEIEILEHTLDLATLKVADVMRPADEMVSLNLRTPLEQNLSEIIQHHYSRYPVYDEHPNQLKGIIHVKDLFAATHPKNQLKDLQSVMRPLLEVDRDMPATSLFEQFREGFAHFAIVKNDSGSLIGFVTLDNILGAVFGHIRDEFNKTQDDWTTLEDGGLLMKGNLPLYSLEKALDIELEDVEEIDTIMGFIMARLERLPHPKERISFDGFDIVVHKMKGPRILWVKVYPK